MLLTSTRLLVVQIIVSERATCYKVKNIPTISGNIFFLVEKRVLSGGTEANNTIIMKNKSMFMHQSFVYPAPLGPHNSGAFNF